MHYVLVFIVSFILLGYYGWQIMLVNTGGYLCLVWFHWLVARLFTKTARYYEALGSTNLFVISFFPLVYLFVLFVPIATGPLFFSLVFLPFCLAIPAFWARLYFEVSFFSGLLIFILTYVVWAMLLAGLDFVLEMKGINFLSLGNFFGVVSENGK